MDQAKPVARIDVISDAICPWCYIGKRQLERALVMLAEQKLHFASFMTGRGQPLLSAIRSTSGRTPDDGRVAPPRGPLVS